jgi:hypothetical protein
MSPYSCLPLDPFLRQVPRSPVRPVSIFLVSCEIIFPATQGTGQHRFPLPALRPSCAARFPRWDLRPDSVPPTPVPVRSSRFILEAQCHTKWTQVQPQLPFSSSAMKISVHFALARREGFSFSLQSSDQKTWVFLVFVMLLWWFLSHTRKVFNEMWVRQWEARWFCSWLYLHLVVFSLWF